MPEPIRRRLPCRVLLLLKGLTASPPPGIPWLVDAHARAARPRMIGVMGLCLAAKQNRHRVLLRPKAATGTRARAIVRELEMETSAGAEVYVH